MGISQSQNLGVVSHFTGADFNIEYWVTNRILDISSIEDQVITTKDDHCIETLDPIVVATKTGVYKTTATKLSPLTLSVSESLRNGDTGHILIPTALNEALNGHVFTFKSKTQSLQGMVETFAQSPVVLITQAKKWTIEEGGILTVPGSVDQKKILDVSSTNEFGHCKGQECSTDTYTHKLTLASNATSSTQNIKNWYVEGRDFSGRIQGEQLINQAFSFSGDPSYGQVKGKISATNINSLDSGLFLFTIRTGDTQIFHGQIKIERDILS